MDGFQSPPFASAAFVAVVLALGNLVAILTTQLCASGTIQRGGLAGIRTNATRASDAAWQAGHRAALPIARVGNGAGVVTALLTLLAAKTVLPYLLLLGVAVLLALGSVLTAAVVAHRAASRLPR